MCIYIYIIIKQNNKRLDKNVIFNMLYNKYFRNKLYSKKHAEKKY